MTFSSPDGSVTFSMAKVGFIDDTTCITSRDPSKPLTDMLQRMQDNAQLRNDLLWSSGGCLELPKCGYHTIYYRFHSSSVPYLNYQHTHKVTIKSPAGEDIPITQKNIYIPRKNLGHLKSPAGTYKGQYNIILEKTTGVVDGIISSGATRSEARLFYDSVYRPTVEYMLPQSFLSPKRLSNIETKKLPNLYACCGFNRNTSRAVYSMVPVI